MKNILIIIVGILVLGGGYYAISYFRTTTNLVTEQTEEQNKTTASVLRTLSALQKAQIDTSIFTSTLWNSLVDIGTPLPNNKPGKSDLFGAGQIGTQSSSTPSR
jgi:hypothetical protein